MKERESLFPDRETALREILGEVLSRGHFAHSCRSRACERSTIKPPERSYDEDAEWVRQLAEFAEAFDG